MPLSRKFACGAWFALPGTERMSRSTSAPPLRRRAEITPSGGPRPGVLVLDEAVPAPPNTGKRIRTLNLLRLLANEFRIEMIVHGNEAGPEAIAEAEAAGIRIHVAPSRIPRKSGPVFPLRLLGNLFSKLPYSVASHHRPGYARTVNQLAASDRFDLVHVEWSPYATYLGGLRLPAVVAAHNVESQIWERMAQNAASPLTRRYFALQAARMHRFEQQVLPQCAAVTAVSEIDRRHFLNSGCKRVAVVPNGVDTTYFAPLPDDAVEPSTLVFTGSMDWRPNQEAIRWFAREVHPRLVEQIDYRLLVVGRNPPDWLATGRGVPPQITATGTVGDVRPYLARAALFVVPLRSGGGTRLKILEAMAAGRPVLSTTVGAEGLGLTDGRHAILRDGAEEFADAVAKALGNASRCLTMRDCARRLVTEQFDWSNIARRQGELWRSLATAHRGETS